MSTNPGSSSSSAAASMNSFPSSLAPDTKPETYDTKDQIDKMVKEEIRIAEALKQHPDAVWCGSSSSQDEPHMWDNLKALFLERIKHENQEPENKFEISEPWYPKSKRHTEVNVRVKKKQIPGVFERRVKYYHPIPNEEFYQMETKRDSKKDGISVISVKNITQEGWSTNYYKIDKDYQDTWRKILKESE